MSDSSVCPTCGGTLEEREIQLDFQHKGRLVVVEGVPAQVCPDCGERLVSAGVSRAIDALLEYTRGEILEMKRGGWHGRARAAVAAARGRLLEFSEGFQRPYDNSVETWFTKTKIQFAKTEPIRIE